MAPLWVPASAKIHIDFVGGTPQGRAWVEGPGEVGIEMLLGNDLVIDGQWNTSDYDPAGLDANGYLSPAGNATAFIGASRTKLLAGATLLYVIKQTGSPGGEQVSLIGLSEDGATGLEAKVTTANGSTSVSSWNGGTATKSFLFASSVGFIVRAAYTLTATRFEAAANGNAQVAQLALTAADFPSPPAAMAFDLNEGPLCVQSITLYDPLSIAALVGLSGGAAVEPEPEPPSGGRGSAFWARVAASRRRREKFLEERLKRIAEL